MSEEVEALPLDDDDSSAPFQPPTNEGLSGCACAAIGCGVLFVFMLVIGGLSVFWIANNVRRVAVTAAVPTLQKAVSNLNIPEDQQQQIDNRIQQLGEDFEQGDLSLEDLGNIAKTAAQGPLAPATATLWFTEQYINKSNLSADEKSAAIMTTRRFGRGILSESIPSETQEKVRVRIAETNRQGETTFKSRLSDAELKSMLKEMADAADAAGIEKNVPEINFADEFDRAVDEALGKTPPSSTVTTHPGSKQGEPKPPLPPLSDAGTDPTDQPKSNDSKPEDPKPEDPKPEDSKPEDR